MLQRGQSSLSLQLDLEAADYFRLDPSQLHFFHAAQRHGSPRLGQLGSNRIIGLNHDGRSKNLHQEQEAACKRKRKSPAPLGDCNMNRHDKQTKLSAAKRPSEGSRQANIRRTSRNMNEVQTEAAKSKSNPSNKLGSSPIGRPTPAHKNLQHTPPVSPGTPRAAANQHLAPKAGLSKRPHQVLATSAYLADSSSGSTNSLPSISSSPSVSPSLVCPHVSLDDLLSLRSDSKSPHTIGLCAKCRLVPPPNVHSPLSPLFRGSSGAQQKVFKAKKSCNSSSSSATTHSSTRILKRGYSDQAAISRRSKARDDSLDFGLDNKELRRLQLSPTVRHSVEFIRNNSIEAGRVLKIYKNGEPFDRPLRICVLRKEFASLSHLLDHLNGRQFIAGGARYLFHLDGQLVYSVEELKHGSAYIVSGRRSMDQRTSSLIKERESKVRSASEDRESRQLRKLRASDESLASFAWTSRRTSPLNSPAPSKLLFEAELKSVADASTTTRPERTGTGSKGHAKSLSSHPERQVRKHKQVGKKFVDEKPAASLIRAKSELSALPNRRKKNVTFEDTGRGSSPAICVGAGSSAKSRRTEEKEISRAVSEQSLATSEIGIQVSDTIEGFLIDLPLPLPAHGEEAKLIQRARGGVKGSKVASRARSKGGPAAATGEGKRTTGSVTKRKVVTITERQLSNGEMHSLADLDHGDHHNEAHKAPSIEIKLEGASDAGSSGSDEARASESQEADGELIAPDPRGTIVIGQEPDSESNAGEGQVGVAQGKPEPEPEPAGGDWQYADSASGTPTQRPVSQSEASARVTTPTPSLSTAGDSNSLSMSYEQFGALPSCSELPEIGVKDEEPKELPEKQRPAVLARRLGGVNAPSAGFALAWVGGFAINDLYPENSAQAQQAEPVGADGRLLSPAMATSAAGTRGPRPPASAFKPSERFHNWLCYSKRHEELLYPTGSLVVLWNRWRNEQRYYAGHTCNVSALALASIEPELAVSAQEADPDTGGAAGSPQVRIWSLGSLETLLVVGGDHFVNRRVFSLRLRGSRAGSARELCVASRDKSRLFFHVFRLPVDQTPSKTPPTPLYASKALRPGQLPLLIQRVPLPEVSGTRPTVSQAPPATIIPEDAILSLGRRHLQLLEPDFRRRRLGPYWNGATSGSGGTQHVAKANCMARLSASEFLVGCAAGSIGLLTVTPVQTGVRNTPPSSPRRSSSAGIGGLSVELAPLVENLVGPSDQTHKVSDRVVSITALARVTGSVFVSADSGSLLRFWRIERAPRPSSRGSASSEFTCRQLSSISLPRDLGFVCSLLVTNFRRAHSLVEFYVASTSNAILFGRVQLPLKTGNGLGPDPLANSSLSVVCEGHETSVTGLVADASPADRHAFFTCSLDCRVCRWSGARLLWKSLLPSPGASIATHPTGNVLAVGSTDGTVYVLDKRSGLMASYFPLTPVCIACLAYSRDGRLLAVGCANGSIFIMPVGERGLSYTKVSIVQSPLPVVSLQFSLSARYILTSVKRAINQDLILWDLSKFRYMRENVLEAADRIEWFDSTCSGSEDVRAIWDNANLNSRRNSQSLQPSELKKYQRRPRQTRTGSGAKSQQQTVVNLSCHRLIRSTDQLARRRALELGKQTGSGLHLDDYDNENKDDDSNLTVASDTHGYLRLFRYPCYDTRQGFFEARVTSSAVNCCRFLNSSKPTTGASDSGRPGATFFVSASLDGSICLWKTLEPEMASHQPEA